jgi:DNA polymerase I-like protein with 3'-5' exonuclease and polymerase domains
VSTPFGRRIEADQHHALNYIIQSTTSDLFLDRMIAVHKFLADKKSFISFSIHDSLVIDFAHDERNLISEVAQIFSQTIFADFLINISEGKNYGEMKTICKL